MKGRSAHKTTEDTDSTLASHVVAVIERLITCAGSVRVTAPVHVELAPRRREAVPKSSRRRLAAARGGGELSPNHGGRVKGV